MKPSNLLTVAFLCAAAAAPSQAGWRLVWSDEFDGTGLPDQTKWSWDVGGGGWGNSEQEFYTDRRVENARQENGSLVIEARKETWENRGYTSARLVTRGKGDWLYGRVEVKAMLPTGKGMWPAIWLLPTDWAYGDWPRSGELDIMENVGSDPDRVHSNIHTAAYNHSIGTNKGNNRLVTAPYANWHVYRLDWYADRVEYYVDDEVLFTFRNEGTGSTVWPFDKRFHLILNIAVGGSWGGAIDDAIFPQTMKVDWVRVYQQDANLPTTLSTAVVGQGRVEAEKTSWSPSETALLRAVASEGWTFARWNGDLTGADAEASLAMSDDRSVQAWFRPEGDLLVNGDFAADGAAWSGPSVFGTAAGTGSIADGVASTRVSAPGSERWNVQLYQDKLVLERGQAYTVRFRARAAAARSIDVSVEHDADPWVSYSRRVFDLGTGDQTFSWTFRMDSASDAASRLVFNLGLEAGDVVLDDVRLLIGGATTVDRRSAFEGRPSAVEVRGVDGRVRGMVATETGSTLEQTVRRRFGAGAWIIRSGTASRSIATP